MTRKTRKYTRDKVGKFAKSAGKLSKYVPNYRRTETRTLGDTTKEGKVHITRSGVRLRKKAVRLKRPKKKSRG